MVIFNKLENEEKLNPDEVEMIQSYFRLSSDGIIIGKSNSPIEFFAENERVGFRENGVDIAYWEKGTMHVENLIAVITIVIGYHQISKYDSPIAGDTTLIQVLRR